MAICNRCGGEFYEDEVTSYGDWYLCETCVDDI